MKKKKKNLYVDKEIFHNELVKYKQSENKQASDKIGFYILQICNNLAKLPNFRNYTYIDEMIGDGIENAIQALDSYDISNPKRNPFWYFSKIAYRSFPT